MRLRPAFDNEGIGLMSLLKVSDELDYIFPTFSKSPLEPRFREKLNKFTSEYRYFADIKEVEYGMDRKAVHYMWCDGKPLLAIERWRKPFS